MSLDAGSYDADNPVAMWMRNAFDAPVLAADLKAREFKPDTDWWNADRAALFAGLLSPVPMLRRHVTVVWLDSTECPAMAVALGAVELGRLDWRTGVSGLGDDEAFTPPGSHADRMTVTLQGGTNGGRATIEAPPAAFEANVMPMLRAADDCETARRKARN